MRKWKRSLIGATVWGSALAVGVVGYNFTQHTDLAYAQEQQVALRQQLNKVETKGLSHAEDLSNVFRTVGKIVEPSVVNINVRKKVPVSHQQFDPDLLRRMFPDRNNNDGGDQDAPFNLPNTPFDDDSMEQVGTGSGVIMDVEGDKGYVLTNNHVAGGAEEMLITLADGREIKNGKLLGADPKSDLAVVEINAKDLVAAKWGDSKTLDKGDWVMAFGSPFGYVGSMTHGIVSALNRQAGILGAQGYESFIQVDAPINPGNSGGPLVDLHGDVVGINTAIASRSGGFQGIGFAIPSEQAKFVYNQIKEHGRVTRGWLGVGIRDVSKYLPLAESFGYQGTKGVLVDLVMPGTPAQGKLQKGDIITQINGKAVDSVQQLRNAIAAMPPKTAVNMTVFRHHKQDQVTITLGEQPENLALTRTPTDQNAQSEATTSADALGIRVQNLTADQADKMGLDVKSGVVINRVDRNSPAAHELLRPGTVITMVGDTEVHNVDEFQAALKKEDIKKGVRLYVTDRDGSRFVLLQPESK